MFPRVRFLAFCLAACALRARHQNPENPKQPSLLPGDPNSEFSSADVGEARDDSDLDVDGLLELDGKGEVITGYYGKVGVRLWLVCCGD